MAQFYDNNFGFYSEPNDVEVAEFYFRNQQRSVEKQCADCGRWVRILPQYDCCNGCADIREGGGF